MERHPAYPAFLALRHPVQQLLWMHEQAILTADALDDMAHRDGAPAQREAVLEAALQEIERANDLRNGRLLDQLLAYGMITPAQDAAARRDPSGLYNAGAAELLYELILFGSVSAAEFAALRQRLPAAAGDEARKIAEHVQVRLAGL